MAKRRTKGEGSLLLIKGCKIYYAQFYENGKQKRVSTGQRVKQKALAVLRRLVGDSERGLPSLADAQKIHYGDLRTALLANYTEKGNRSLEQRADGSETIVGLKQLDDFFGYKEGKHKNGKRYIKNPGAVVARLTTDAARKFARQRAAEGAGTAMINRSLACLRRMLRIAYEDRKIPAVPKIRLLKEPSARKGFLELEKFEELLRALPAHLHSLVLFLYWCGVRLGEAMQIQWQQVDLQARLIRLEEGETKNDEPRIVPLPAMLVNLLSTQTSKVGRVFDDTNLRSEWARACAAVGLGTLEKKKSESHNKRRKFNVWEKYSGLIVHDLRRSAVRNLRLAGVPENVSMKISGHKTRSVFDRYNIVSVDDISDAMRRVETNAAANGAGRIIAASAQPTLPASAEEKIVISENSVKISSRRGQRQNAKSSSSNKMGA
jgi:integrase